MLYDLLLAPFIDNAFMRRALVGSLALALGCGPIGTLLVLRRLSLMGDALSHAVLPGAAIGFMLAGLSIWAMGLGGFAAGVIVALLAGLVTRTTGLKEDTSFAALYLLALASGVMIISVSGTSVDLIHILFGSVLAVDDTALMLVAGISSLTLLLIALAYRPLVLDCFDPGFLRALGFPGASVHLGFLVLVVLNLIAGFQSLGTLMSVGLMMVPAAAARFWGRSVWGLAAIGSAIAAASGAVGLVLSFHLDLPSGPSIVLTAGCGYLLSLLLGPQGGLMPRLWRRRHLRG